jgi:hypothetical protein
LSLGEIIVGDEFGIHRVVLIIWSDVGGVGSYVIVILSGLKRECELAVGERTCKHVFFFKFGLSV